MEQKPFIHSENPEARTRRVKELNDLLDIPRGEERRRQIINELSSLALEKWWENQHGTEA